jgi:UDP-glucuronate 4-epimerase
VKILVTGHAGFIGMHVCARLLAAGHEVVGVDNFNDYYDVQLKRDRAARLAAHASFTGCEFDLADAGAVNALFTERRFDRVIHLAAQAGVRYSLTNPRAYVDSNVVAFVNVLEALPPRRDTASRLREQLERLRHQLAAAVLRTRSGRSSP